LTCTILPPRGCHGGQPFDLLKDRALDFREAHGHPEAAEVLAVRESRVGADADAAAERQADGPRHGVLVARVGAASHVGRGDELHQRGRVRGILHLAHVAVEVQDHGAGLHL